MHTVQMLLHNSSLSSLSSRTSDLAFPECCTKLSLQYLPRRMTPLPSDNEFRSLGKRCLDFAKASQSNGLDVKLSLSIGRVFSFNYSWENNDNSSLPAVVEDKPKKKTKSPYTRRRDQLRRANFRNRKKSSLGSSGAPLARNGFNMDVPVVTASKLDCPVSSPSAHPSWTQASPRIPVCRLLSLLCLGPPLVHQLRLPFLKSRKE